MKIKIENQTDYDTKWLRKIFNRSKKMVDRRLKRKHLPIENLKVDVVYAHTLTKEVNGYAYLNGNYIRLRLVRPPEKMKIEINDEEWTKEKKEKRIEMMKNITKEIAKIFVHELYHCYGYEHTEMFLPRKKIWIENTYNYNWTEKYPVQLKIEKPKPEKPKIDIQVIRYQRVLELLKEKQSKLKRIQNQIRKYMNKKRYYEKVLVAKGKLPKEKAK